MVSIIFSKQNSRDLLLDNFHIKKHLLDRVKNTPKNINILFYFASQSA